jgi:hypothetical protein
VRQAAEQKAAAAHASQPNTESSKVLIAHRSSLIAHHSSFITHRSSLKGVPLDLTDGKKSQGLTSFLFPKRTRFLSLVHVLPSHHARTHTTFHPVAHVQNFFFFFPFFFFFFIINFPSPSKARGATREKTEREREREEWHDA